MEENKIYCSHCGALIEDDDYEEVNGEIAGGVYDDLFMLTF